MVESSEARRDVSQTETSALARHEQLPDFGLAIGVDHYPRFRSLRGAIDDAVRFHTWLCEPDGAGVAPEHARLVVSTAQPVAPLQDQVDDAILELLIAADRLGGGRRLYVYFGGHGAASPSESGDDVALLLAKWSRNLARLALSVEQYRGRLASVGVFQELAIFLDCCRTTSSGAVGLPPMITFQPTGERRPTRSFVAYATEIGRPAFEQAEDGHWQGVFTRCLLAILRRSPNGIPAGALQESLEREVQDVGGMQRAHVVNGLPGDARFGRRRTLPELHVTHRGRRVELLDGRGIVIAERDAASDVWRLALWPGLYKLRDNAGHSVLVDHDQEVTSVDF